MTDTIQEQKKIKRKSYEELSLEIRAMIGKTAVVYVPELAYALLDEGLTNKQARDKILSEWGNHNPWADLTIYGVFPKELRDPEESRGRPAILVSKNKREGYVQEMRQVFKPIPKPPEPVESEPTSEGQEITDSQLQKFEGSTKTTLTKFGDVNDACKKLWLALTEKENMPYLDDDMINDHIKPTREYRKFVYELNDDQLATIHNRLSSVVEVANDMLEIIEKAKK